ncbi:hypothetical protein Tdes44962_MAKER03606 [Teratosphaeria destructans]|uniref:Uncharacterized protein n=1 Tax=Teratosphaeria destructans TaxID=418781 RepID=A0A9W7W0W8_9PEZI|nr:hypothetical protein Tdes44962_MAKER03606 [Teratosphaeria destructans]
MARTGAGCQCPDLCGLFSYRGRRDGGRKITGKRQKKKKRKNSLQLGPQILPELLDHGRGPRPDLLRGGVLGGEGEGPETQDVDAGVLAAADGADGLEELAGVGVEEAGGLGGVGVAADARADVEAAQVAALGQGSAGPGAEAVLV